MKTGHMNNKETHMNVRKENRMIMLGMTLVIFGFSTFAWGSERALQLRTVEDPDVIVEDAVCNDGGFFPNVRLGAAVWTYQTRAVDGGVINDHIHRVGTARACVLITDFRFVPQSRHPFYIRFDIGKDVYTALGDCTVGSNDVPVPGLVLAGCTLRLVQSPPDVLGGSVVSTSVFNPSRLPGFSTGSYWAFRLYDLR